MLEREWISITNPDDPYDRYVFDVSFLLSSYTCIYGAGCPGTAEDGPASIGCCKLGAHYTDDDDRAAVEERVELLGPEYIQFYDRITAKGPSKKNRDGSRQTRVHQGACIFHNRDGWKRGAGCAFHQYAIDRGEHHMTYKPEVCWLVPLRREVAEDVHDDGEEMWVTTITSYDRGAWGPGGSEFPWWCTDSPEAYVGAEPVYRSMEHELREMVGDATYDELAAYLDDRAGTARKPLPILVQR